MIASTDLLKSAFKGGLGTPILLCAGLFGIYMTNHDDMLALKFQQQQMATTVTDMKEQSSAALTDMKDQIKQLDQWLRPPPKATILMSDATRINPFKRISLIKNNHERH